MEYKKTFVFQSLGTNIEIFLVSGNVCKLRKANECFNQIQKIYSRAMRTFSRFDPQSELFLLNASLGKLNPCSPWILEIAKKSLEYHMQSNGYLDPRIIEVLENFGYNCDFRKIDGNKKIKETLKIGTHLSQDLIIENKHVQFNKRMDFSGIVKGFITDQAANYLKKQGFENFLVNSGGDIYAAGHDANEQFWYVEVEGIDNEKLMLKLTNQATATSGISRRKWKYNGKEVHHLINPKDPQSFSFKNKSVTVVAEKTEHADMLAKTLFICSEKKDVYSEISYLILDYRGQSRISPKLKQYIY